MARRCRETIQYYLNYNLNNYLDFFYISSNIYRLSLHILYHHLIQLDIGIIMNCNIKMLDCFFQNPDFIGFSSPIQRIVPHIGNCTWMRKQRGLT